MSRKKQLKPLYKKKRSRLNDFDIFSMVFVGILTVPLGVYLLYKHYDNEFGLIFGIMFVLTPLIVLWYNKRSPGRNMSSQFVTTSTRPTSAPLSGQT